MKSLAIYTLFSAVLFAAGLVAGQKVHQDSPDDVPAKQDNKTTQAVISQAVATSSEVRTAEHTRISGREGSTGATSSPPRNFPVVDEEPPLSTFQSVSATRSIPAVPRDSPKATGNPALMGLIQRMMPEADEETVAIWAETYADMDLEEVEFVLQQKRAVSVPTSSTMAMPFSMLATTPSEAKNPTDAMTPPHASTLPAPVHKVHLPGLATQPSLAIQPSLATMVRKNLQAFSSIGYRRLVVLPEAAASDQASLTEAVAFRSFEAGRYLASPVASHVAISPETTSTMFMLDGNRLTRRGDFCRLSDGRIGLVVQRQEYAIAGSPVSLVADSKIEITSQGEIFETTSDAGRTKIGAVAIARVSDLASLQTDDGVLFTPETPVDSVLPSEIQLLTQRLELSNVNFTEETQLYQMLSESSAVE